MVSEPCFFPVLTMADDAAIAAMEMANLALANAAAYAAILPVVPGVEAAVAIPPVVTPVVGEPFVAPVLPVAPTASEAIQAAGLRVAASAARIPAAPPVFDVPMHEAGTSLGTVARHEFNRAWLPTASAFSAIGPLLRAGSLISRRMPRFP